MLLFSTAFMVQVCKLLLKNKRTYRTFVWHFPFLFLLASLLPKSPLISSKFLPNVCVQNFWLKINSSPFSKYPHILGSNIKGENVIRRKVGYILTVDFVLWILFCCDFFFLVYYFSHTKAQTCYFQISWLLQALSLWFVHLGGQC